MDMEPFACKPARRLERFEKTTFFSRLSRGVRSVLPKNGNSALISMPTCYRVHLGYLIFVEMAYGAGCVEALQTRYRPSSIVYSLLVLRDAPLFTFAVHLSVFSLVPVTQTSREARADHRGFCHCASHRC